MSQHTPPPTSNDNTNLFVPSTPPTPHSALTPPVRPDAVDQNNQPAQYQPLFDDEPTSVDASTMPSSTLIHSF